MPHLNKSNSPSWMSPVHFYSDCINLPRASTSPGLPMKSSSQSKFKFKNILKKTINKLYVNEWYTTRQDYCSGKLDTYCKLKTHFGCEKYINEIRNFSYRRSIIRFRISAHRLKIETGRYIKLDRSERLSTKCSTGAIEDEQHFLMECSKFNAFRNSFFSNH